MNRATPLYVCVQWKESGPWHLLRVDGTTVCGRRFSDDVPGKYERGRRTYGNENDFPNPSRCAKCWRAKDFSPVPLAQPPERQLSLFDRDR